MDKKGCNTGLPVRAEIPSDANYPGGAKLWKPGTPRPFSPQFNFNGVHSTKNAIKTKMGA